MSDPYQVVRDFESALCEYTGSKYAVTVNSCTMALLLALKWHLRKLDKEEESSSYHYSRRFITIPNRTYISVPQSIIHAGGIPKFEDKEWLGYYQLKPYPVFDCARWFSSNMYDADPPYKGKIGNSIYEGNMLCVSFHWTKTLAIGQGGAILHDNPEADKWFRKARYDGRTEGVDPKDDHFNMIGYHCYMSPRDAAEGLSRLAVLPKHNDPLPNDDYPDLSKMSIFT